LSVGKVEAVVRWSRGGLHGSRLRGDVESAVRM